MRSKDSSTGKGSCIFKANLNLGNDISYHLKVLYIPSIYDDTVGRTFYELSHINLLPKLSFLILAVELRDKRMFSSYHHLLPSLSQLAQNSHRQIRLKKLAMMQVQRTIKRTDKSKAHSAKYQSGLKGTRWLTAYQHRAGR